MSQRSIGALPEAGLLPELGAVVEILVATPDIVDQDVEPALLLGDPREQRLDLRVVAVVAAHGDALAGQLADLIGGLVDRAGQRHGGLALLDGPAGDIDRRAGLAQPERDASANAAAGPGDQRDLPMEIGHTKSSL